MEPIDLFETAVRFLAVKPLQFDNFDYNEAQDIIKKENEAYITFVNEHGYFEQSLEAMLARASHVTTKTGTIYVNVQGMGCTERVKRRLLELSMVANKIVIFGNRDNWPSVGPNVVFSDKLNVFKDNHQRFFIFHSPSLNIALISRHEEHDGAEVTEALITNKPEAVDLLGSTIATRVYPLN